MANAQAEPTIDAEPAWEPDPASKCAGCANFGGTPESCFWLVQAVRDAGPDAARMIPACSQAWSPAAAQNGDRGPSGMTYDELVAAGLVTPAGPSGTVEGTPADAGAPAEPPAAPAPPPPADPPTGTGADAASAPSPPSTTDVPPAPAGSAKANAKAAPTTSDVPDAGQEG